MKLYTIWFQPSAMTPPEEVGDADTLDEAMGLAKKIMARLGHSKTCTIQMEQDHHVYTMVAPVDADDLDECPAILIAAIQDLDEKMSTLLH
jgi:hypothetical protein